MRPAYSVIYSFKGKGLGDGAHPTAGLIDVTGTLYGTTPAGGANGEGTVFAITTSGKETVLYSFGSGSGDGGHPAAGLTDVNGMLYGTTSGGGAGNQGTVFSITTSGAETVLHSFGSSGDGSYPYAGLTHVNGTLYGTTEEGGYYTDGTVFSITTTGKEAVLHSFGDSGDGAEPQADLINVNGTLYGTTFRGGANCDRSRGLCGTVFSTTTSGTESVLHTFGKGSDGRLLRAGLINVKGRLYGTTQAGGKHDDGTVFSITTAGNEAVLHSFGGSGDAADPLAGLSNLKGTLYGTTYDGGGNGCFNGLGCGTVFSVTTTGTERVLYSFLGGSDGASPQARLINVNGTLYGTTSRGGAHCLKHGGCGAVFTLSP
ncbi:MAG: choice-of-anchor tandem repeat GloVer-containing protein [Candidatus Cybelea sp.]